MPLVGRLHEHTTGDDLTVFVIESGLYGVKCSKLNSLACTVFKCAVFCVSCAAEVNEQ